MSLIASPERAGLDRLEDLEGPAIFVANHHSHLDTALMLSTLPDPWRHHIVVGAAADYFFGSPITGALSAFAIGAIPIERSKVGRRSANLARDLIDDGWSLLLFPEGGRSPDGWGQPFRGGAGYLAVRCGVPVVPVHIVGTGQATGRPLHDADELTSLSAAKEAASQAYGMAGVTAQDIQVAEVHDCFTIAEIIATEDLGFFAPGEGPRAVDEGRTSRDGDRPINTSGGLKAKGHPVGASGVGQVIEVFHQLRGEAGERQLKKPDLELGLTHNVGGTGGTCVVNIMRRG
ncbi:MAG: 1-acyl-sn-glycerol-3-phosphate acyltransferase [Acidobacteria bacterium]|nr:1-acyl-sn-glycerol-3-phosphate acyltransferase [Acidobacteriota bacterium]